MVDPYKLADRLDELYKGVHITEAVHLIKRQADELKYADEMFEKSMAMIAKLMGEKRGY